MALQHRTPLLHVATSIFSKFCYNTHMDFFRRNRLLSFGLFLTLLILLVSKIVWPLASHAQNAPGGTTGNQAPIATNTNNGTGNCHDSSINILEYVAPGKTGNAPNLTTAPVIQSTVKLNDGTLHVGDIQNQVIWDDANTFEQTSGSNSFVYRVDGGTVKFLQDNIWGNTLCDNGKKAIYQVLDENRNTGAVRYNTTMSCGQEIQSNQIIQPYEQHLPYTYNPNDFTAGNRQTTCSVKGVDSTKTNSTTAKLIWQGHALCNPDANNRPDGFDMIVVKNTSGPGAGEIYVYVRGRGLAAFYESIDESLPENQPQNWNNKTDLCDLNVKQSTNASYFEYNIQRSDPKKVLNNFYNEYTVSCLPKAEYQINVDNLNRCKEPGVNCNAGWYANWNKINGDLTFSPNGTMFALFRNEKKVASRSKTDNPPAPERLESIESYLTARNKYAPEAKDSIGSTNPHDDFIHQSPLFKQNTLSQQCEIIKNKLRAVEQLCKPENRIEGDEKNQCAIDNNIPGTSYQHQTDLWHDIQNKDCNQFMYSEDPNDKKLHAAVMKVSPSLETAYRPAFIVAVTKFEGGQQGNVIAKAKNGKDEFTNGGQAFYTVDYLEVKVPAFGSDLLAQNDPNKGDTITTPYRDPLELTADTLQQNDVKTQVQQEEQTNRQKIRSKVGLTLSDYGDVIGAQGTKVFCYDNNHNLVGCNGNTQDNIPPALITFINANGVACEGHEDNFYPPEDTKKIAEQARHQIGSTLDTQDIGNYKKHKELKVGITTDVADLTKDLNVPTHTELFFVSPHNYGLEYARNSFLAFLNHDQLNSLQSLDLLNSSGAIDPEKLSPLLKTETNIKMDGGGGKLDQQIGTKINTPPASPIPVRTSAELASTPGEQHSIFWKLAGQVASFPTRLATLVSTPRESDINQYTAGCTGNFATEDWLLGHCTPKNAPKQEILACKDIDPNKTTPVKNSGGRDTIVSDGLMRLAVEVSKATCTPAELLVGVLAQETGGQKVTDFHANNVKKEPITGDPNEKIPGSYYFCQDNYPWQRNSCGPYSWTAYDYAGQLEDPEIRRLATDCVNALGDTMGLQNTSLDEGSLDTRTLGQAMCVTSAKFWNSIRDEGKIQGTPVSDCSAANKKAYKLSEVDPEGISLAIRHFYGDATNTAYGGFDAVYKIYKSLIDGYAGEVDSVRTSCLNSN